MYKTEYMLERIGKATIMLAFCTMLVIILFSCFSKREEDLSISEPIEIYSAISSKKTQGVFVLGTGFLNKTEYYVFYEVAEDGAKEYTKYRKDISRIHDTLQGSAQPYIQVTTNGFDSVTCVDIYVPEGRTKY